MAAGRPRQFDYDQALDKAMHVFWEKGYEGASLPDLTEAMGINRPSMYAAFGNKEELFRKALQKYQADAADLFKDLLDAPTLRESLERFLLGSAESFTCKERPSGCLAVHGALVGGEECSEAQQAAKESRDMITKLLKDRCDRALDDGDLPAGTNTAYLARFYTTILNGMSIQSTSGVPCDEMRAIAKHALDALPKTN